MMKSILLCSVMLFSAIPPILTSKHINGRCSVIYSTMEINVTDFSASGSSSQYKLLFGGVLGQELTNTTRQDEDISAAIQVLIISCGQDKFSTKSNIKIEPH